MNVLDEKSGVGAKNELTLVHAQWRVERLPVCYHLATYTV